MATTARNAKKGGKTKSGVTRALPAKPVGKKEAGAVRGGRDPATGMPSGKRISKP